MYPAVILTFSLIRILYPLQCYKLTSVIIICFAILENVKKSVYLPSHLLLLSAGKGRKKRRGKACKIEPSHSIIRDFPKLDIQILFSRFLPGVSST